MANTQYSDLISEVLPQLAADPSDPVTEQAIKRAVIEFCRESWVWRYIPDTQDVVAGLLEYDLEPPQGADVVAVLDVQVNNVPVTSRTIEMLNQEFPGWRTTSKTTKHFTQVDTSQILLAPLPEVGITAGLSMTLALQPKLTATSFPSWIANQYMERLADGAVGRLMLMSNKPWSDPANGADHRRRFEAAIANARNDAASALGRAPVRVTGQH